MHSYRDHLHKIQQSKGRAQTAKNISAARNKAQEATGWREKHRGRRAKKENIREEAGGILKTKESARQVREQLCI